MAQRVADWVRIALRLQRFEFLILAAGVALYAGLGWFDVIRLDAVRHVAPGCFDPNGLPACSAVTLDDYNKWQFLADTLAKAALALPIIVGLVFGVPIVAREVEHGTAQVAWSLSPSRLQWLAGRVLPVAALVVVALLIIGLVADRATQAAFPREDIGNSFLWYGRRGVLVAIHGLAWFGIGLAIGSTVGRSLPGLLLAGAVTAAVLIGTSVGISEWQTRSAMAVDENGPDSLSVLVVGTRIRMPDGRLASFAEVPDANVYFGDEQPPEDERPPGTDWLKGVVLGIPGRDYVPWVARESVVMLGVATLFGGWTMVVVGRRRPT